MKNTSGETNDGFLCFCHGFYCGHGKAVLDTGSFNFILLLGHILQVALSSFNLFRRMIFPLYLITLQVDSPQSQLNMKC